MYGLLSMVFYLWFIVVCNIFVTIICCNLIILCSVFAQMRLKYGTGSHVLSMCETFIIMLFCYNTDITMDLKTSVII